MEWSALSPILPLEVCTNDLTVARRLWWQELSASKECRMPLGMHFVPRKEIVVVGYKMNTSVRLEYSVHSPHSRILNHSPLVMSLLGPRIGEVQVNDLGNGGVAAMLHEFTGVVAKHANVLQSISSGPIGRIPKELPSPLDAEEVRAGLYGGLLRKECPFPRANFKFKWTRGIVEECAWIKRCAVQSGKIIRFQPEACGIKRAAA